jgi:glycosyltransferase involved in cell wall biosynthesis
MKMALLQDGVYTYASQTGITGGAERQQWLLSKALAAAGWQVSCGIRCGMEPGQRRSIDGVQFNGLERRTFAEAWHRFLSQERPDWLYWRGAEHLWGVAVEVARLSSVRTIFAAAFDTDVEPRRALTRRQAWWPLYAWGLQRTDRIFVQHDGQLSRLSARWQRKATLVPSIAEQPAAARHHAERSRYVAWVGMLRKPKRPDLLVRLARELPAERFVVCGGPTTHRSPSDYGTRIIEELQQLPNVEYLGAVTPDVAMRVIAEASLLLSTSDEEGFPNTFLQAWSSGTPVVSLTVDPGQLIRRIGLGVVAGDVLAGASAIRSLLRSPQEREIIAVRARQYTQQAHCAATVISLLENAVGGGNGARTTAATLSHV